MKNKSAILPIASIAFLTVAAYFLLYLDAIVNTTLYHFGLQYSPMWAVPYWTVLNAVLALVLVSALTMLATLFFQHRIAQTPKTKAAEKAVKTLVVTEQEIGEVVTRLYEPKRYRYTLSFANLHQAAAFERILKDNIPNVEVEFYPEASYTKLVFVTEEELEDLNEFEEIIKHRVEEVSA